MGRSQGSGMTGSWGRMMTLMRVLVRDCRKPDVRTRKKGTWESKEESLAYIQRGSATGLVLWAHSEF